MPRTRAQFISEFATALDEFPMSLRRLQSCAEQAFVDLHDVPSSKSKLDCPLAACCNDLRAVNACEKHLGVMTIRDLAIVGCDKLLKIPGLGQVGFAAIHNAASQELGDQLLSRDLDQECLNLVLCASLLLREDLRNKTARWLRWAFASPNFAEHLVSLRGMSGVEEEAEEQGEDKADPDNKPLPKKIKEHLDRLNKLTPTKELHDDDL